MFTCDPPDSSLKHSDQNYDFYKIYRTPDWFCVWLLLLLLLLLLSRLCEARRQDSIRFGLLAQSSLSTSEHRHHIWSRKGHTIYYIMPLLFGFFVKDPMNSFYYLLIGTFILVTCLFDTHVLHVTISKKLTNDCSQRKLLSALCPSKLDERLDHILFHKYQSIGIIVQ